ncbi:MAG TPA: DUF1318 domain-containing protein [Verrucomicrobiae bacterium]|nr:DUF1318 domain-containing protein [Verrucomicrobiae bacterium]
MKKTFFVVLFILASMGAVWAAQYDIKHMTPEIQQALQNRQNRYEELGRLKASGAVGENTSGYVDALQGGGTDLVSAENADRRVIYNAIVEQNGLGPGGLSQVEKVFAEVQREKAQPGDPIQVPSGAWTKK